MLYLQNGDRIVTTDCDVTLPYVLSQHDWSRLDDQLKFTPSTFNINFLHYCSPLLDFMVQVKNDVDALAVSLDASPSGHRWPHIRLPILRRISFLLQPSQFIMAWDGHWVMLACTHGGLQTASHEYYCTFAIFVRAIQNNIHGHLRWLRD